MTYLGTSGFSYEDWVGRFYPEGTDKKDMLRYYASCFNAVEINSSYYNIPGAASFAAMDRKTPAGFRFVVKAHKDMTHTERADHEAFKRFVGSIQPLRESGKFGCMLAQFPWSFRATQANAAKLREFKDRAGELPTVIEFRNADWVNQETFDLLKELGLGYCCVDEPGLKGLMPRVAAATSHIGYVRFHGRNAKQWWKHEEAYERYNYLYSEEELAEWAPKIKDVQERTRDTYLFFNNHYQGKSAQNARMLARMLGFTLPPEAQVPSGGQMAFGEGLTD